MSSNKLADLSINFAVKNLELTNCKKGLDMAKVIRTKNSNKHLDKKTLLIALCWIVYTCSYLGKLSYLFQ